ncbi:MAG: hypothetical protein HC846_06895, partial [Blastocatellia bacterium]|nr:hypothetical protein [Blastocatellia bacterium]
MIRTFSPREREAVEYLRHQKDNILNNYRKFTGSRELPTNLQTLDHRWEDFVDLLDVYRRRKQHLKSINRQAVHNQLSQAYRAAENAPDDKTRRIQQTNVEILKRRIASFDALENSVKLVEGQLQSIENFFGYLNDEIVTISTPDKFNMLDFEQLSDSITMTKQMLDATSDAMGALDSCPRWWQPFPWPVDARLHDEREVIRVGVVRIAHRKVGERDRQRRALRRRQRQLARDRRRVVDRAHCYEQVERRAVVGTVV